MIQKYDGMEAPCLMFTELQLQQKKEKKKEVALIN